MGKFDWLIACYITKCIFSIFHHHHFDRNLGFEISNTIFSVDFGKTSLDCTYIPHLDIKVKFLKSLQHVCSNPRPFIQLVPLLPVQIAVHIYLFCYRAPNTVSTPL